MKAFGELEVKYKLDREERDAEIAKKRDEEKKDLKNHYGSLKFKPKKAAELIGSEKILFTPVASSVDGSGIKDRTPNSVRGPANGESIVQNKFLEQIRQKEMAKQKLIKMSAYQKSIHELYMPKQSEKKRLEREAA